MMIDVKDIKVSYDTKVILENFSFSVDEGLMVSIIGPNGCGKSTALKAISKFLKKTNGKVYLQGEDMDKLSAKNIAKKMSVLSQYNRNPDDITVRDLVSYGRIPHKRWYERNSKEDQKVIDWAIKETGLTSMQDESILELSGGERQRVWIAMSLAQEPKVLLLDEPTTGLDIAQKASFRRLLDQVARDRAVLISSHDVADLVKRTQTVLVLVEGRIVAKGSPDQLMGMSNALTLEAAYLRIVSKAGKESRGASSAP